MSENSLRIWIYCVHRADRVEFAVTDAITDNQLLFLEAWRAVDRAYVDRTFNGQSWFRYRENAIKKETMARVYSRKAERSRPLQRCDEYSSRRCDRSAAAGHASANLHRDQEDALHSGAPSAPVPLAETGKRGLLT